MKAVRNIRLCSKDCLCLHVCPTGASDTENGQIDWSKCIGCGRCVNACPSHALSLVPETQNYSKQQPKKDAVVNALKQIIKDKVEIEHLANSLIKNENDENKKQLLKAISYSNRVMAEDTFREIGFMLPQGESTQKFLLELKQNTKNEEIKKLIESLIEFYKDKIV